ncbi:Cohesin domain-containing protein, partial [Candidatus Methanophagaceae archaeon]
MLKDRYNRVMYRKVLKVVSIAVIILSVLVAFTLSASAAGPTADSFGVEDANGYKNTNVTVPVNITNPQNGPIVTIMFNISYNSSIINVTALHEGSLTSGSYRDLGYHEWGIAVTIGAASILDGNNGSVAVLDFSVFGEPGETSYLNLSGIELSDSGGADQGTAPPQNGTFTVGGAQAWYLHNDTKMYKGNMSKPAGTLTIPDGDTTNWTANEAATVDVKFPVGNWTGWLTLNATFATDANFTVAVGSYNTTTSDFSSAGTQKFIGDGSAKAFLD